MFILYVELRLAHLSVDACINRDCQKKTENLFQLSLKMEKDSNDEDRVKDDQLTQPSEEAMLAMTQPQLPEADVTEVAPLIMSEALVSRFHADPKLLKHDCIVFERHGQAHPLCFIRPEAGSFEISIGRDKSSDVVVPCEQGWCGVSRHAFRLLRSSSGELKIKATNGVAFFIRGVGKMTRVPPVRPGDPPLSFDFDKGDVFVFNACTVYFREGVVTPVESLGAGTGGMLTSVTDGILTGAEDFVLNTAIQSLEHIRHSTEADVLRRILPNVIANLTSLLHADEEARGEGNGTAATSNLKRSRDSRPWRGRGRARFR